MYQKLTNVSFYCIRMCPDPLSFEQGQGHIVILNNIVIIKARPIEGEGMMVLSPSILPTLSLSLLLKLIILSLLM